MTVFAVFLVVVFVMLWLRVSPFVVASATMIGLYFAFNSGHVEFAIYDLWAGLNRDALLAIPLLLLVSALVTREAASDRIVDFLKALCHPLPGGPAVVSVFCMAFVAVLSASPSMAILLVGPVLLKLLMDAGYARPFAIGLLCTSSLGGVLVPPSLSLTLYGSVTGVKAQSLYLCALPLALVFLLALVSLCVAHGWRGERTPWVAGRIKQTLMQTSHIWGGALLLYAAFYVRVLSIVQAAVLFLVVYVALEALVLKRLTRNELKLVLVDLCTQLGRTLPLIALSVSLATFLIFQQVPAQLSEILVGNTDGANSGGWQPQWLFVLVSNALMLIVGSTMALDSGVVLAAAALHETAQALALEPSLFGVMVVFNLSLGLLTPPSGLVLVAAMFAFKENITTILRAIAPFYALLLLVLSVAGLRVLLA